jgi:cysteine sulfinate desulfinase/cysteine desulfurase-like protein
VLSVSIGGIQLKDLLERIKNYSFSAGCSCLGQGQSNVMLAIDPEGKLPSCTIRISFSPQIKAEDLITFTRHLKNVILQLRQEKKVGPGCSSNNQLNKLNDFLKDLT